jgi:hypothetical protein
MILPNEKSAGRDSTYLVIQPRELEWSISVPNPRVKIALASSWVAVGWEGACARASYDELASPSRARNGLAMSPTPSRLF